MRAHTAVQACNHGDEMDMWLGACMDMRIDARTHLWARALAS